MEITTVETARKLHLETQRIKADLAGAKAALQAAREAAAVPKPTAQTIGPAELENARLSDLAGLTDGKLAELEAARKADAQALVAWQEANAAALAEVARQEAAVRFHTGALKEARRLELIAMSEAAQPLQEQAAAAYVAAFEALQAAGAELAALNAIRGGAWLQRMREGTNAEPLSPLDVKAGPVEVPALGALDAYGRPKEPGAPTKDQVHIDKRVMLSTAGRRVEEILNTMKGRAQ